MAVFFCNPYRTVGATDERELQPAAQVLVPQGTDLRAHSKAEYDRACAGLNSQPRRQYGLPSADERYAYALACTDR